jgi:hypothetical protein
VFVRKLASIAVTAGLLVTLSACSGTPFSVGGCTPQFGPGGNAALVTADAGLGKDPKAQFPTPLVADDAQAQVIFPGDGEVVAIGDMVDVQITIYDGATGDSLISTDYEGRGITQPAIAGWPAFGTIAQCAPVGSRVAAVGTAADLIGPDALAAQASLATLAPEDTVVLVVDVLRSYLGRASGADQVPQAGFPAVVLAPNGRPGLTFVAQDPPAELRIANLKNGTGATVEEGDSVVVHYTGVLWGASEFDEYFDSTWARGVPATLVAADFTTTDDQSGVVPGLAQALIGQKVGSQVIVVIPPEFGYPAGSAPASIGDGATLVFVFDVLGIG